MKSKQLPHTCSRKEYAKKRRSADPSLVYRGDVWIAMTDEVLTLMCTITNKLSNMEMDHHLVFVVTLFPNNRVMIYQSEASPDTHVAAPEAHVSADFGVLHCNEASGALTEVADTMLTMKRIMFCHSTVQKIIKNRKEQI